MFRVKASGFSSRFVPDMISYTFAFGVRGVEEIWGNASPNRMRNNPIPYAPKPKTLNRGPYALNRNIPPSPSRIIETPIQTAIIRLMV